MNIQMNEFYGIGICDKKYFQWKHCMVFGANW
jgi:hypothetical protein